MKKDGKWAQYDLKEVNKKKLTLIYNYFKSHYKEVFPRIQKMFNGYIGDIQVKIL